jgi:paraquat-inducible protein A
VRFVVNSIYVVRGLLVGALVLLIGGLSLPSLTITRAWVFSETVSIWTGIWDLWEAEEWGLFSIVFTFSVLFPAGKIFFLSYVAALSPTRVRMHTTALRFLEVANRFSMLDVFAAALLVVITRLDPLVTVNVHSGVYVFGASVICVQLTTMLLLLLVRNRRSEPNRPLDTGPSRCAC